MMIDRLDHAVEDFRHKPDYEAAAMVMKYLLLGYSDDAIPIHEVRSACSDIAVWMRRQAGDDYASGRLEEEDGRGHFLRRPSVATTAEYLLWLTWRRVTTDKEEVITALFEIYTWLVQTARATDIYFRK